MDKFLVRAARSAASIRLPSRQLKIPASAVSWCCAQHQPNAFSHSGRPLLAGDRIQGRPQVPDRRLVTGSNTNERKHALKERFALNNPQLSATTIVGTALNPDKKQLEVTWNDGDRTSYPYVWLRDSCQCSACFQSATGARRLTFHELNFNLMPEQVELDSNAQEIAITWPDDHRSIFRYGWLLARSFRYAEQAARARWNGRHPVLWGSNLADNIPQVEFSQLLTSDEALYDWLTALEEKGFVLLTGVAHQAGQLHRIAERVAFLRSTNLGETSFEHHHSENSTDPAYMLSSQELHNDLTYYGYVPGVKMVHCISQPMTGDVQSVLFVDGFMAASQMKERYPDQFRLLTTTKLDFLSTRDNSIMIARHPTIKLDDTGEVIQVNYSTRHRDSFSRLPIEEVEPLYKALQTFAGLLYGSKNLVEIKLKNDVIYCFNNWRVLHGRKAFQIVPGSEPNIERGYIDWDELHSERRILKSTLRIPDDEY